MAKKLISSFNGGEMSPLLDARLDSERALNGCRTLKNFIPKPQGGAILRPPTEYLGSTKSDAKARLLPFNFSTSTRFVIELTNLKARFWSNGALVLSGGSPLEVATPWPESALFAIQHFQENDIVWLTHPDYAPRKLIRVADDDWELVEFKPDWPPVAAEDFVETQRTLPVSTTGTPVSISLGASGSTSAKPVYNIAYVTITGSPSFVGTVNLQVAQSPPGTVPTTGFTTVASNVGTVGTTPVVLQVRADLQRLTEVPWYRINVVRTSGTGTAVLVENVVPIGRLEESTVVVTPQASGGTLVSGDSGFMRCSDRVFTPSHIGGIWQVGHIRTNAKLSLSLSATGTGSTSIRAFGTVAIATVGVWHGTVYVESQDPVTDEWEVERFWDASGNRNISDTVTIVGVRNVRLRFTDAAGTPSGTPTAYLQAVDSKAFGLVRIEALYDNLTNWGTYPPLGSYSTLNSTYPGNEPQLEPQGAPDGAAYHFAKITVVQDIYATTATHYFNEGAWSDSRGYPRTVVKHEQRMCFAGTRKSPQTLWLAELNEPLNFTLGSLDTSPLEITLDSNNFNGIQWLLSQREGLAVGTSGDEWIVNSGDGNKAITPTSIQARRQSYFGSASIRAESGDDVALFVQRGATKVREFTYTFERDQFAAIDLSVFSEHVLRTGVVQTAFASQPDGSLWCVCTDGSVAVLAYERTQQVVAWWRFVTDGQVESVAVVYGGDGLADEVWMSVKRTINGSTKRYVERIPSDWWSELNDGDMSGMCYADCRISKSLSGTVTSVTGLGHLEGKTVWATCNGVVKGSFTVTSGAITVPSTTGTQAWKIGLPYEGILKPMRTELQLQSGSAQGRRWRVSGIDVFIWNTYAALFRHGATGDYDTLPVQTACNPLGTADTLQTGIVPCYVDSSHLYGLDIEIKATGPMPTNILAIVPTFEVYG